MDICIGCFYSAHKWASGSQHMLESFLCHLKIPFIHTHVYRQTNKRGRINRAHT